MIPLIDASPARIAALAEQLGVKSYGQLITPLTGYSNHGGMFAIDNGGYSRQDMRAFERILRREEKNKGKCAFVCVPDVVGSARLTLELFHDLKQGLADWPLAFVCQDGQEDLSVPWGDISAIFIGGSTEWKMSRGVTALIRAANWRRIWTHVGRINTGKRWEYFAKMGVGSCDGSAMARPYPGFDAQRKGIAEAIVRQECEASSCGLFSARCAVAAFSTGLKEETAPTVAQE